MKVKDLIPDSVWQGKPLKLRDMYSAKDIADAVSDKKPTAQTVILKNTSTGEIIGKRTIYQK